MLLNTYSKKSKGNEKWDFNIKQSKGNADDIKDSILKELGVKTGDEVIDMLITDKKRVIEVYEDHIADLNLSSVILIHGPGDETEIKVSKFNGKEILKSDSNPSKNDKHYSLITGDCNIRKNIDNFKGFENKIGYALVPHHSGKKEWDDYLCTRNNNIIWIVTIAKINT